MKIINRYIYTNLAQSTIMVLLAFVVLYAVFEILMEGSKNLGIGSYTSLTMLYFIFLRIPSYAYQIMPIAILIGAIIALTRMSSLSEYVIIRTSGISAKYVLKILCIFAACFAFSTFVIGEWIMPTSQNKAEMVRHNALNMGQSNITAKQGLWLKTANEVVEIGEMLPDRNLLNIKRYIIHDYTLSKIQYAKQAHYQQQGNWLLLNVDETELLENQTHTQKHDRLTWNIDIDPNLLNVLVEEPEKMSAADLRKYINHLKQNKQQTVHYEVARWNKIFYPLAAFAMILLAVAFTPTLPRYSNMGLRIIMGMCLGLAFHFAARFFGFYAQLFNLTPIIAASLPIVLFTIIAWFIAKKGMSN